MESYIKYKAQNDKKANASKLKKADYVCVLQPKADHQRSRTLFTKFCWIVPFVIEELETNNNYLVRKIRTNKTQMLQRLRLRQFAPHHPKTDVQIRPQECKSDLEVSIKIDDMQARAWDFDYECQISTQCTIKQRYPIHPKMQ